MDCVTNSGPQRLPWTLSEDQRKGGPNVPRAFDTEASVGPLKRTKIHWIAIDVVDNPESELSDRWIVKNDWFDERRRWSREAISHYAGADQEKVSP